MGAFCWAESHELESADDIARRKMFESAFTYNTERNYNNHYTNWAKKNYYTPSNNDDEDRARLADLRPTSIIELVFVALSFVLLVCTLPFSLIFSLKFVSDFERLVVLRLGKAQKVRGPGTTLVLPCIDKTEKIDIRVTSYDLPGIHVITVDKGIVEFSTAVFCKVIDPLTSYCNIQDKDATTKNLAYTSIYKQLAKRTLHDITAPQILSKILRAVQDELNHFTVTMGVEVVEVTVTKINVIKPAENQAMNVFNTLIKSEVGGKIFQQIQGAFMEHVSASQCTNTSASPNADVGLSEQAPPAAAAAAQATSAMRTFDPEIEQLIEKIRHCLDESLVARVRKCYRVVCEADSTGQQTDFLVDLKHGAGWATWTAHAVDLANDVDVTFCLSKQTLFSLVSGDASPFSAYMNGSVRIAGSVSDAVGLKFLMERAREVKCI